MGQAMTDRLSGLSTGNARARCWARPSSRSSPSRSSSRSPVWPRARWWPRCCSCRCSPRATAGRTAGREAPPIATAAYLRCGGRPLGRRPGQRRGPGAHAGRRARWPGPRRGAGPDARGRGRCCVPPRGRGARAGPRLGGHPDPGRWRGTSRGRPSDHRRAHDDRTRPVLVGVGPSARGASFAGGEDGYGDGPMTTSGGWPPEPPHERAPDEHVGAHAAGGAIRRTRAGPTGPAAGRPTRFPAADDDWEAVQASWRRQNGLPTEDEPANGVLSQRHGGRHDDWGAPQASAAPNPWGPPARPRRAAVGPVGHAAGPYAGPPSDPWARRRPTVRAAIPIRGARRRPTAVRRRIRGVRRPTVRGVTPIRGARRRPTAPAPRPTRGTPLGPAAPPSPDPWGGAPNAAQAWDAPPEPQGAGGPWSGLSAGTWGGPGAGQTGPMWDDPAVSPSTDDPWGLPTGLPSGAVPAVPGWPAAAAGPAGRPVPPPRPLLRPPPSTCRPSTTRPGLWIAKFETGCRPSGLAAAGRAARSRSCSCRCPTARSPSCRTAAR